MKKVSEEDFTHGRRFRNNVTRIRNVTYEINQFCGIIVYTVWPPKKWNIQDIYIYNFIL